MMRRADPRVATASAVARTYRIRKAAVLAAIQDKTLPARRRGRAWICSLKRADELFGTGLCP
jgi:hypothetical protein